MYNYIDIDSIEFEGEKFKIGDILYCHNIDVHLTKGKAYIISSISDIEWNNETGRHSMPSFNIINDIDFYHHFYFFNYKEHFYTIRDIRKLKLYKILNNV